ncbi:unnamed protein product [Heligmosomoides polygyrus]|uniref:Col_cuticle_N domain-containing protein n=1 Tax=Heligmosomoides polygyrus TaxID=6339 RepID=A0A183G3G9_HELPZ|nr:unnamed protein product [Heligmosomoides polygyrus]
MWKNFGLVSSSLALLTIAAFVAIGTIVSELNNLHSQIMDGMKDFRVGALHIIVKGLAFQDFQRTRVIPASGCMDEC